MSKIFFLSVFLFCPLVLPAQKKYFTVQDIPLPQGYQRIEVDSNSIQAFVRKIQIEEENTVYLYDGKPKPDQHFCYEVLKIDVGNQNLQQCADAAMRIWAEFLYYKQDYEAIHFNFTSGDNADYISWREGYRYLLNGNQVTRVKKEEYDDSYLNFRKYLDIVFMYAGSYSIDKELMQVDSVENIKISDVLIKGGSPGHVMIVMDIAKHEKTGEIIFLLAQSAIPAQSVHIVINEQDEYLSPWYSLDSLNPSIQIQEWTFTEKSLKRFEAVHPNK